MLFFKLSFSFLEFSSVLTIVSDFVIILGLVVSGFGFFDLDFFAFVSVLVFGGSVTMGVLDIGAFI